MPDFPRDPLLDMFIFDTNQLLEQFEQRVINVEKAGYYEAETVNEIFRIMHTIKGSSAMMGFDSISSVAHSVEDLFDLLKKCENIKANQSAISDIVFECIDFIKAEVLVVENGGTPDKETALLIKRINAVIKAVKEANDAAAASGTKVSGYFRYRATIFFEKDCAMESLRAFALLHNLKEIADVTHQIPENDNSDEIIRNNGYKIWFGSSHSFEDIHNFLSQTVFLEKLELTEEDDERITLDEKLNDGVLPPI